MIQKTLVILKPDCLVRGLVGEVTRRFELKGLHLCGMKMMKLTDSLLNEHYAHLKDKPFFSQVKNSMLRGPVIVCCYSGFDAVEVVRTLSGTTNGRKANPGTIRGDFSMSFQENIIHASDSLEHAKVEIKRFFKDSELFTYDQPNINFIYGVEEL